MSKKTTKRKRVRSGTVRQLIELLRRFPMHAEVVVDLNITNAWGVGYIEKITPGVFKLTEYGNDFFPYDKMPVTAEEVRAICIGIEEPTPETPGDRSSPPATLN